MIRIIAWLCCGALLLGTGTMFSTDAAGAARAKVKPICYNDRNCTKRINNKDAHNCARSGGSGWRARPGAACQAL
jgi:hypothetical protein